MSMKFVVGAAFVSAVHTCNPGDGEPTEPVEGYESECDFIYSPANPSWQRSAVEGALIQELGPTVPEFAPIQFQFNLVQVQYPWAVAEGVMCVIDGGTCETLRLADLANTEAYGEAITDGLLESNVVEALVNIESEEVHTWTIGATDVWWDGLPETVGVYEQLFTGECM